MLTVSRPNDNQIRLSGVVDGTQDLHALLPGLQPGTVIDCEGVTRINSIGIKAWVGFFSAPEISALSLKFSGVSIPLVEQLNMFRNFIGGGTVISVMLPFRCNGCRMAFSKVFEISEALRFKSEEARQDCVLCGKQAQFDDIADEFFQFLDRKPRS